MQPEYYCEVNVSEPVQALPKNIVHKCAVKSNIKAVLAVARKTYNEALSPKFVANFYQHVKEQRDHYKFSDKIEDLPYEPIESDPISNYLI